MGQITQRQTTLALISIIFITLLLIFISTWLPENLLVPHRNEYLLYLFMTAVLWLITWFDWRYSRHLTVALITVVTATTIPETSFDHTVSQSALIPPILAMVITGIPGVIGSAIITWLILLGRGGIDSVFTNVPPLVVYALAVTGLVLGRLAVDARLAHERDLLQALMDNIPDLIYFKDTNSRFIRVNTNLAKFLRASDSEEVMGKTDFDFQSETLAQAFYVEEQEMMNSGQPIIDRIEHNPTPDGRDRWLSATKSPIYGKNGRVTGLVGISRDVTQRVLTEEALRFSEEQFTKVFRSSGDAISLSTLADGRFIDINNAHSRIFGYSRPEVIGQTSVSLNLYADPADRDYIYALVQKEGAFRDLEVTWRRKSGELFDGLVSAEIITVHGAQCIVGTVRDITSQKQAAAALEAYARELERSNQELENFAHIASHDLQEPLRKIQTFSHRLLERYEGELDERGQDYLQRMDSAAARMQMLITDLLAYARIGTNGSTFSSVNLVDVAQEVLADLEVRIKSTDGQVIIGNLPTIEADLTQMRQLLQNLISNGLKFHRPDVPPVIQIDGRILTQPAQPSQLHLTISDNGIGFDEKYLPQLFAMFQRLHGREDYEGTGIGLAICRRIVEQHHGSITAQSQPGVGTTFIITLPLTQT